MLLTFFLGQHESLFPILIIRKYSRKFWLYYKIEYDLQLIQNLFEPTFMVKEMRATANDREWSSQVYTIPLLYWLEECLEVY